jgi:hypothetical protein
MTSFKKVICMLYPTFHIQPLKLERTGFGIDRLYETSLKP